MMGGSIVDYSAQTGIFDPRRFVDPVHVIGCGGIGSALVFPLAKLGVREIHVWDKDEVEPHNIPCQLIYRPSDVGMSKVAALRAFLERQEAECTVIPHEEFVTDATPLDGIVITGVDSMASRSAIWAAVSSRYEVPLLMDGRIGGERLQLLTLNPSDIDAADKYEQWLFPDSEAAPLPCAERTVIHPPTVLAGLMIAQLTLYLRDEVPKANLMFDLKTMQFTTSR